MHDEDSAREPVRSLATDDAEDDPPVVARMVVEIRSDGRRTIARGALEDGVSGQRVAVELTPTSPWEMAKSVAKLLLGATWRRGIARRRLRSGD